MPLPAPILLPVFLLLLAALFSTASRAEPSRHHASVLMYHHISADTPRATSTDPDSFKQHLDLLQELGFQVWPLPQVAEHLQHHKPLPDKVAVLTFDDAYISVYDTAMPMLKQRKLPFTIFVNAEPVNQGNRLYMSWEQLREAQQQGGTIANHSLSHPHMIRLQEGETEADWLQRMRREIEQNQQQLAEKLGQTAKLFAYPYGEFNPQLEALLSELGYLAFGQQSGPAQAAESLQGIARYAANGIYANPKTLKTKLLALPFPVISASPASGVLTAQQRSPELELKLAAGDYRIGQLRCYGPAGEVLQVKTETQPDKSVTVRIRSQQQLNAGRHRYNCTAPAKTENRWFWFSRQWMLPKTDGRWYKG